MSWQSRLEEHRATAHIPWTPQETALALELREGGSSYHEIAHALQRTIWGVRGRFRTLGQDPLALSHSRVLQPYPGVERCKCGLTRDESHQTCDLAKTVTEHVARFMKRPGQ
jgi:hypothetical protein